MRAAVLALVAAAACCGAAASAQSVRMVLQSSRLAGFGHGEAATVFPELRVGDALALAREPDNRHDPNAVRVEWRGHKLGYVPRHENAALAWGLDRGGSFAARISRLAPDARPSRRIEFEVIAE